MSPDRLQRLATQVSIPVLLLLLVGLWYAVQLKFGTEFVENWLPASAPSRVALADFSQRFGNDQPLLVSWQSADLDDPRIERATGLLEQLWRENASWPITAISNSQQAVDSLCGRLRGISREEAVRRLAGNAVGSDGSSFIVISMRDHQPAERDQIIAAAIDVAQQLGIKNSDLILAGEPYQTYMIDYYSRTSIERYVPVSVLISLLAAWWCLRSLPVTLVVLALAGVGQLVGMSLISAIVGQMGAILIVVPTLLFTLTLSAAVHLSHYLFDCRTRGEYHPEARAIKMGFLPCVMAAATTAFGFLSLTTSDLEPVYQFGLLSALGMMISISVLLILFIPSIRIQELASSWVGASAVLPMWFVPPIMRLVASRSSHVFLVGLGLLFFFSAGTFRLNSTTRFDGMFPPNHPSVTSLRWIEEHVSPIESLELVVKFPSQPQGIDLIEQLSIIGSLRQSLDQHQDIHSTFAASCVLPSVPQQQGARATIRRSVFRQILRSEWDDLQSAKLVFSDSTGVSWRITARFKTATDADFHRLRSELEFSVRQSLEAVVASSTLRPEWSITGLRMVIETANRTLIRDLATSFATAFLLITPAMMVVARSFLGGFLLMLPNLLPVTIVFGAMGWLNIPLDVASILTASVALGIAVDDTLHCTYWYLRYRRAGQQATAAMMEALRKCARPMLHTTLICIGAMVPFLFCEFLPTGKFALLMILILSGALLCDLIFLPGLLCSPFGRWIGNNRQARGSDSSTTAVQNENGVTPSDTI